MCLAQEVGSLPHSRELLRTRWRRHRSSSGPDNQIVVDGDRPNPKGMARYGTRVGVRAGRHLTTEGKRGAEAMLVLSGTAVCLVAGKVVALIGRSDVFGEVATLDRGPRTATVVALTEMELIVFTRPEFENMITSNPEVASWMLQFLARRLRDADPRMIA